MRGLNAHTTIGKIDLPWSSSEGVHSPASTCNETRKGPRTKFNVYIYFQDFYQKLLEAESEGILEDVDMTGVEKLILDPNRDRK